MTRVERPSLLFGLIVLCFVSAIRAQLGIVDSDAKIKPTLMLLGTYHMGAQGNNTVKLTPDDVTSPERQKQIVELVSQLKRFKPTKIALECDVADEAKVAEKYDQYLAGTYHLSKNETNQIGFRLAKELGHKKVYCVDWGIFPKDPDYYYEKYSEQDPEFDSFLKKLYANLRLRVDAGYKQVSKLSIARQLSYYNQPAQIERDNQLYFEFMRIGRADKYVGANYVSWWYGRNMKIFDNIIRITDSAQDRILVVYGSGHLKLLTEFAQQSGFYKLESPLPYLKHAK